MFVITLSEWSRGGGLVMVTGTSGMPVTTPLISMVRLAAAGAMAPAVCRPVLDQRLPRFWT